MDALLGNISGIQVLLIVVCVNIMLTAAQKVLELVKDKTATDFDNKAHKVISFIVKALDWITANAQHKNDK